MASPLVRWLLVALVVVCVLGLVAWARGLEHHRGQSEGALGAPSTVAQSHAE